MRGAAAGLLFGDGQFPPEELAGQLTASFHSTMGNGSAGAGYLRGVLATARSVLWQVPAAIEEIHRVLAGWDETTFVAQLPFMRLALADLTPRECDRVARAVGAQAGAASFTARRTNQFSEADLLRSVALNTRLAEGLKRDGLESYLG
jgi:hypothetical protein